jgi:hypothetical protein
MVSEGLINPSNPVRSLIGDPTRSPLVWVNPSNRFMPADDNTTANPAGRAAIIAWVTACAQNN